MNGYHSITRLIAAHAAQTTIDHSPNRIRFAPRDTRFVILNDVLSKMLATVGGNLYAIELTSLNVLVYNTVPRQFDSKDG